MLRPFPLVAALVGLAFAISACSGDSATEDSALENAGALGSADAFGGAPPAPDGPAAEWQAIAQKLSQLQQVAVQDPEIDAQRAELQRYVEGVMSEIDPEIPTKLERFQAIQVQLRSPEFSGDSEAAQPLLEEAMSLQADLRQAQTLALSKEEVLAKSKAFEARVIEKMKELDPETESMISRADSIAASLQAQAPGVPGPVPGAEGP